MEMNHIVKEGFLRSNSILGANCILKLLKKYEYIHVCVTKFIRAICKICVCMFLSLLDVIHSSYFSRKCSTNCM